MEIISFIGIVAALILIILGSVRGYSLILLSTVAALLVAATGGVNVFENYANVYMGGVANMVLALFPIFLGGQMFGKMLEMSGLPMAVASGVFRKLGPASAVAAVYLATLAMSVGGIDVFVIIFTMYPLAAAFFKAARHLPQPDPRLRIGRCGGNADPARHAYQQHRAPRQCLRHHSHGRFLDGYRRLCHRGRRQPVVSPPGRTEVHRQRGRLYPP